jgi:hypothetical protein
MSDQLMTRAQWRARGAVAFRAGHSVDDHHMNPWSDAVADWQSGWREEQAWSSPRVQHAPAARQRVEQEQAA